MFETKTDEEHQCSVEKQTSGSFLPPSSKTNYLQRVLRTYKKFIQISRRDPLSEIYFRSTTGFLKERKRHADSKYTYIIHPFSEFAFFRQLVLMITLSTTFVTAPFITAFTDYEEKKIHVLAVLEIASTVIYICDIIIKFFLAIENPKTKEVILERNIIWKKYLTSFSFVLDIVTAISVYPLFEILDHRSHFLTCFRLLKIYKIFSFNNYWNHIWQRWNILPVLSTLLKYIIMTMFVLHWITCLFFYIPYEVDKETLGKKDASQSFFIIRHYPINFYKASALLLCANKIWTDECSTSELWLTLVINIFGKIYMLTLTVTVLNLVLNQWSLETKYLGTINQLNEFMVYKKLPLNLRERIRQYFNYKFKNKFFRENLITSILSDKLKKEMNIQLCKRLVQQAPFLAELPTKVLGDVLIHMKSEIFLPNDIIIRAGSPGDCMYFLSSGTVVVTTPSGKEVCHLTDGAYFGEIALVFKDLKRTANVMSLEISETFKLDKRIFKSTFKKYPECMKMLQVEAEARHQTTNALEDVFKQELFHKMYIGNTDTPTEAQLTKHKSDESL